MEIQESKYSKKKIFLIVVVLLIIFAGVFYLFFYYPSCDSETCFSEKLRKCASAKFIKVGNISFQYKILGIEENACDVEVLFLRGELSNQDLTRLNERAMICSLERGVVIAPESSLDDCAGELKEGLQDLVISRLHKYIVQNIGKINADLFGF